MNIIKTEEPQKTIYKEAVYKGIGLHTGNKCHLVFKPALENQGVVFVRTDLPSKPTILASYKNVTSVIRGTTIGLNGDKASEARVHTIEHVLSALSCLGIDNVIIEVNANEPPVADGSALPFIEVLQAVGIKDLGAKKKYFQPDPLEYQSGETLYKIEPADELIIETTIDFDHPLVSRQTRLFHINQDVYLNEISRARTFCFDYEVEALKTQGLARGGSLDNAVVVGMDKIHNKEKNLRYPDEFVRHKTLDLIGDLFLLGIPLKAKITASRVGHGHNVKIVGLLAEQLNKAAESLTDNDTAVSLAPFN